MDGCRCILTDGWTGGTIEFVQLIARCGWMDEWVDGWMDGQLPEKHIAYLSWSLADKE